MLSRSIDVTIRYAEVHLIYGFYFILGEMVASRLPSWRHNMFLPFSLRDRQSSMQRLDRSHISWSYTFSSFFLFLSSFFYILHLTPPPPTTRLVVSFSHWCHHLGASKGRQLLPHKQSRSLSGIPSWSFPPHWRSPAGPKNSLIFVFDLAILSLFDGRPTLPPFLMYVLGGSV